MGKKKIAFITGGSKGIGAATAILLAEEGYEIWLNYRADHGSASNVSEKIQSKGADCKLLPFDISDREATNETLEPMLEKDTPYALINNAGLSKDALMVWMTHEEWHNVLSVNLNGFFYVTQKLLTEMLRKRQGRIVNIVSTAGQKGLPGQVNYSAAKAGLIGATKALAAEVAKRNIRVNAVSPGFIRTSMTGDIPEEQILPMIPMGRLGTPEEVAWVVSFLCSEKASYINGQVIGVNGGVYM